MRAFGHRGPPIGIKGGPLEGGPAALQDVPLPPITELGLYVVSCSASGAGRKLHFTGSCWRRPGIDYKFYVSFGSDLPPRTHYQSRCRQCWPDQECDEGIADPADELDSDDISSSSDSG